MTKCREWFDNPQKIMEFLDNKKNQEFEIDDLVSILVFFRKNWYIKHHSTIKQNNHFLKPIFVFRKFFLDRRGGVLAVSYIPANIQMDIVASRDEIWAALEELPINKEDLLQKKEIKFSSYCKDLPPKLTEADIKQKFKKVRFPC